MDGDYEADYKYIHFVKLEQKAKTSVWACCNNRSGSELGQIKWYGPWRQYCFFPEMEMVFSASCLEDINDFIEQLKRTRR